MTNTQNGPGRHRTEAVYGTVVGTSDHPRGHCSRLVGQINAASWRALAAGAAADATFRREYRARRADLAAALTRVSA
jgi:hypothetical protein